MANTLNASINGYQEIINQNNNDPTQVEQTPQEKLFARVTELLSNAGVTIRGSGSLALDVDENNNIEVIGNIDNKDEIVSALGDDSEILFILKGNLSSNGNNSSSDQTSKWSQEAYSVELNGKIFEDKIVGDYLSTTINKDITGEFYGQFNTYYDTDEYGFKVNSGVDFAFEDCIFDTRAERDSFFNYINEKLTSQIDGLDSVAGMRFSLEKINSSKNLTVNNFRIKVESAKGEQIDQRASGILNGDSYVKNGMYNAENKLHDYHVVVDAHYSSSEQNELNVHGVFESLFRSISGVRHYSPETENNKEGIAAAQKMWDITKNASRSELSEYAEHPRMLEDNKNEIGKKYGFEGNEENRNKTDYIAIERKLVSTAIDNAENVAPGSAVATAQVKEVSVNDELSVKGGQNVMNLLGIEGEDTSLEGIMSQLQLKIDALKNEGMELTNEILNKAGIKLDEGEKFKLSVGEDNSIVVTAMEGSELSEERIEEIQEALNVDKDKADKLANILKESAGNSMALNELSTGKAVELSEETVFAVIESRIGMQVKDAIGNDGKFITDDEKLDDFFEKNSKLAERILRKESVESTKLKTEFTFTGESLSSNLSKDASRKNEMNFQGGWQKAITGYYDIFNRAGIKIFDSDIFADFSVTIDYSGNIDDVEGEMRDGSGVNKRLVKDLFAKARNYVGDFDVFIDQLFEQHDSEHGDVEEFEHFVKIDFSNQALSTEFSIISPEADKAAEKELNENLRDISENVNNHLKEEYDISTPIEVKVDEDGKLTASTESLAEAEAIQVESVIDLLNQSLTAKEELEESGVESNIIAPKGLGMAFDKATGLKDILAKFHEHDNLLKAIN